VRREVCWEEIGSLEDSYLLPSCEEISMLRGDREEGGFLPAAVLCGDQYAERR